MVDLDDYARKYSAQYEQETFETILIEVRRRQVLESLDRYSHEHVLEVGCGLEPFFVHYSGFKKWTVIEPSSTFAEHARSLSGNSDCVTVIEERMERAAAKLKPSKFDMMICSSLLHEVEDPQALLAAIRSLCQATTVVHFNVPNVYSFHRLLAQESGLIKDIFEQSEMEGRFQRHTRFDMDRLLAMLRRAGFEVLASGTYFIKPFSHGQMDAVLEAGIADQAVVRGLEKMIKYMPDMGCELYAEVRAG